MARRDRTTGLPRPRARQGSHQERKVAGLTVNEQNTRIAILGGAAVLLVLVLALLGWRWYDQNYRVPEKVILRVGEEQFKLQYYADRLFPYAQAQAGSGVSLGLAEQALMGVLEDEALVALIARDKGITVTEQDITNEIAAQLGVPVGGAGSSFDTLYRQRLKSLTMSDGNYRRQIEAQVYRTRLIDAYKAEMGETGEMVTLRAISVPTKEEAEAVLERIKGGEDMGTVAQTTSNDLTSRQKDGVLDPEPPRLYPESVRTAIEGKEAGPELFGPIEVATNFWVFRIEKRDPEVTPSDTQKNQLADLMLDDDLAAKRLTVTVQRSLNASDITWAEKNAD
jgi:parvulin-like peptidyl-prolyl isomerase